MSQWAGWGLWPLDLPIGVGGFAFVLFCFCFVSFDCCVSLLLPSIHDDVREFLATFGNGERGGVFYIPLSSLKIVDSIYASQHCIAFVLGATQTNKNQFSRIKICALDMIQREYNKTPLGGVSL